MANYLFYLRPISELRRNKVERWLELVRLGQDSMNVGGTPLFWIFLESDSPITIYSLIGQSSNTH